MKAQLAGKVIQLDLECPKSNLKVFLKKYPKSCTQLTVDEHIFRCRKFVQRFKLTKGVQSIYYIKSHKVNFNRTLSALKSQRRYIKKLSGLDKSLLPYFPFLSSSIINMLIPSSVKSFSKLANVERLTLNFSPSKNPKQNIDQYDLPLDVESRFWKHLSSSRHSKFLLINGKKDDELILDFLSKLNGLEHILEGLINFVLNLSFENSRDISSQVFMFNNILKYVTKVEISDAMLPASHYLFDNIHLCPSLKTLLISNIVNSKLPRYLEGKSTFINFEPIRQIATLQNLQRLDITIVLNSPEHFKSFLTLFVLPESITSISLTMQRIKWSYILRNTNSTIGTSRNPFEENAKCLEFYNQWERLRNLDSLAFKFEFGEVPETVPTICFLVPLLKKVSNIRVLDYMNQLYWEPFEEESFNFQYFWTAIDHLKSNLKRLWIEDRSISMKNFVRNPRDILNLSEIIIYGSVTGAEGFKNVIKLFKTGEQSSKLTTLYLKDLYIDSDRFFSDCIRALVRKPINLDIKLHVDVSKISVDVITQELCQLAVEGVPNRTISLYLVNSARLDCQSIENLSSLVYARPVFEGLRILATNRLSFFNFQQKSQK